MELYKVCINHESGMTLTYFTVKNITSTWGKNIKMSFEGKT